MVDLYKVDAIYRAYIDEAMMLLDNEYDCGTLKQRLNDQRTIRTSIKITDIKSSIIRRTTDVIQVQDTENIVFASNDGGGGGILFGENSVCIF
jgi:hypothetical protein